MTDWATIKPPVLPAEPNISKLASDLRDEWYDSSTMQRIIVCVAATYGEEVLRQVLDLAVGSAAHQLALAEAEFEGVKKMLAENGFVFDKGDVEFD